MSASSKPTVLITGAAGHLGSHLIPTVMEDGFEVRGLDMAGPAEPLPDGCRFYQADLSNRDLLREALEGVDVIVHTASIHPWKSYTDDQYIDSNVKGTWTLYSMAAEMGIERIVLTSSIAAVGMTSIPMDAWPVREDALFRLGDIYSYTKYTQETIARMYADSGKIQTIALRPPAFMPTPELETCMAMIGPFAVVSDIASAHAAALRVICGRQEPGGALSQFEAFNTTNRLPYTAKMCREMDGDIKQMVKTSWPDAYDWLCEHGFTGEWGIVASYDITKAKELLGWEPAFNFEEAYEALASE